ncbi:MAG: hypothetical protein V2A62_00770 [Candidatus Woesearchaeota archaeon]
MAKEVNPIERKISMVAAASEALIYRKKNPACDSDRVLQHISKNVAIGKDEITKMGMIAAATEAITISQKNPALNEKDVIRRVMDNLPGLIGNLGGF